MTEKICLITGGAGFIGSHLVDAFVSAGWKVRVLDCHKVGAYSTMKHSPVEFFCGRFDDRLLLKKILPGVDVLIHLASTTTPAMAYGRSAFDVETNLIGTLHLLEECLRHGVYRVIFPSSGGTVYGKVLKTPITEMHPTRPISSHGIIKLAIENYIQMFSHEKGLKYTILRIANPYGPRQRPDSSQGAVAVFVGKLLQNHQVMLWGNGTVVRDFIYIDDLVRAFFSVLNSKQSINQIFNIGSGVGVSIRDLLNVIENITEKKADVIYHPARDFDVPVNILAIKKARSKLNWEPEISLLDGISRTVPWVKNYFTTHSKG